MLIGSFHGIVKFFGRYCSFWNLVDFWYLQLWNFSVPFVQFVAFTDNHILCLKCLEIFEYNFSMKAPTLCSSVVSVKISGKSYSTTERLYLQITKSVIGLAVICENLGFLIKILALRNKP